MKLATMDIQSYNYKHYILLASPPLLLISTFFLFRFLSNNFGRQKAYLYGFLFYWLFWCLILPLITVGLEGLLEMFGKPIPKFGKPGWLGFLLLLGPPLVVFLTQFSSGIKGASIVFVLLSLFYAIFNGTFEEIFWRGSFVIAFNGHFLWGYLYPAIWFGLWHISPQIVESGMITSDNIKFALISIILGLVWGWVARTSGSIKWTVLAHILLNFASPAGGWFINSIQ